VFVSERRLTEALEGADLVAVSESLDLVWRISGEERDRIAWPSTSSLITSSRSISPVAAV
jgi:hypothetical protein